MKRRLIVPAVLAFAVAVAACGGPGNPSWRKDRAKRAAKAGKTVEFAPAGEPVEQYNDPAAPAPRSSRLIDALLAAVTKTAEANGKAAPQPDGRLFAMADDLAGLLDDRSLPPYEAIEFSMAFHGVIEPSPHLITVAANDEHEAEAIAAILEKLPEVIAAGAYARVGVGLARRDDGETMIVLALLESGLETDPIPRALPKGGAATLRGRVLYPYDEPRVFITGGDGTVGRPPVLRDDAGAFRAQIDCGEGVGRRQVEVTAQGPRGVTVLANFPVWCGEAPPRTLALAEPSTAAPVSDVLEAEREIFELANQDRRKARLPALVWSDAAAKIARAHSEDMHANRFVAHVSPTTGSASDRTRAAGLGTPLVLENVARAFSAVEAELGFMNSPGHRANLLSTDATHVGIGVVLGDDVSGQPELYVTQLFYRVPPRLVLRDGLATARKAIASQRKTASAGELRTDQDLDAVAQRLADALAKNERPRDELAARAGRELDSVGNRYGSVITVLTVVGDPADIEADGIIDPKMRAYGLGLAQGNDAAMGENALFVVIILARDR